MSTEYANPRFSEVLLGFPVDHSACRRWAMRSYVRFGEPLRFRNLSLAFEPGLRRGGRGEEEELVLQAAATVLPSLGHQQTTSALIQAYSLWYRRDALVFLGEVFQAAEEAELLIQANVVQTTSMAFY